MTNQIISRDGHKKVKKELECLTTVKREEITKRIKYAKEMGDLSENAEYQEAKDAQGFNERRIAELKALLKNVIIVENEGSQGRVGMGSRVTVKVNDDEKQYTIVSFIEVDPAVGKISNESPLGMVFLERKVGDIVKVSAPKGEVEYEILKIE